MQPNDHINGTALHESIASRAYQIYRAEGCPLGRALDHWLKAESEIVASNSDPSTIDWAADKPRRRRAKHAASMT